MARSPSERAEQQTSCPAPAKKKGWSETEGPLLNYIGASLSVGKGCAMAVEAQTLDMIRSVVHDSLGFHAVLCVDALYRRTGGRTGGGSPGSWDRSFHRWA